MKKIAFCAAAGNGISPLEQIMLKKGYDVYGSDNSFEQGLNLDRKRALEEVGLKILPQNGSCIFPDTACLYISSIINENNPDVKAARRYNIPIKKRSDLLEELLHGYEHSIAVGGTAGKTTTTAMIGYILDVLGLKPCMINGGMLCNYEHQAGLPNYIYNEGDICVIEADESDGSIQKYHPYIGIVNNISHDHTSMAKLLEYFGNFASHVRHALIVNDDCPYSRELKCACRKFSFSLQNPQADLYAADIAATEHGVRYSLDGRVFELGIIGEFNVANALAAIAACMMLGVDKFAAAQALEGFTGIKMRLEKIGTTKDITFYADFAHNPSKIAASAAAIKAHTPNGKLIMMYQPHTPFSVSNTGDEVAEELMKVISPDDVVLMQEIYEITPQDTVSSRDIINKLHQLGHAQAYFMDSHNATKQFILNHTRSGDRVVIMGAHDNTLAAFCREIFEEM